MSAVPAAFAVARPVLLTDTTDGFDEPQLASVVIVSGAPVANVATADNCDEVPIVVGSTPTIDIDVGVRSRGVADDVDAVDDDEGGVVVDGALGALPPPLQPAAAIRKAGTSQRRFMSGLW